MSLDPVILGFLGIAAFALVLGAVLKLFKQPSVIAYILTGLVVGPYGFSLVRDHDILTRIGDIGLILLLFFLGMEINLKKLISNWKLAIFGTSLQILISVIVVGAIGLFIGWPYHASILLGFVISASSTAVILKVLESKKMVSSKLGTGVLSVVIAQDLFVVPMIIILNSLKETVSIAQISTQIFGAFVLIGAVVLLMYRHDSFLPFKRTIQADPELQVLAAFILCFGFSFLSGLFQLSTGLGAFIAGIYLSLTKETTWAHESLHPFKALFVGLFFISIGLLIDIPFLLKNWISISILVLLALLINTLINYSVFRRFGSSRGHALYAGALLAQIGEFGFLLAAVGLQQNFIGSFGYQMTIITIALSLLVSPLWVMLFEPFYKNNF